MEHWKEIWIMRYKMFVKVIFVLKLRLWVLKLRLSFQNKLPSLMHHRLLTNAALKIFRIKQAPTRLKRRNTVMVFVNAISLMRSSSPQRLSLSIILLEDVQLRFLYDNYCSWPKQVFQIEHISAQYDTIHFYWDQ